MACYQIVELNNSKIGASTKARADVTAIASKNGFNSIDIVFNIEEGIIRKILNRVSFILSFIVKPLFVKSKSIILIQTPFIFFPIISSKYLLLLQKVKKFEIINFVHDVDELRNVSYVKRNVVFSKLLKVSSQVVSHNLKMTQYLARYISKDKIIDLGIFDYLSDLEEKELVFKKSFVIAGNLDPEKSAYVYQLNQLRNVTIELFGTNYVDQHAPNIVYHGAFPAEELATHIEGGFGLVWDGDSLDTCSGHFGNYLRYNNPHKVSFYLSCGLPVVVWKESALSKFVLEHNVGIVVESLEEAENIICAYDISKYNELLESTRKIRKKLVKGYYSDNAIKRALGQIKDSSVIVTKS